MFTKILIGLVVMAGMLGEIVSNTGATSQIGGGAGRPLPSLDGAGEAANPVRVTSSESAVERAQRWVDYQVPLNSAARYEGYPADDAGFISFVWQLPPTVALNDELDWSSAAREQLAVAIPPHMLRPGDVLTNWRAGEFGHALLFVRWGDPDQWADSRDLTDEDYVRAEFEDGIQVVVYEMTRTQARPRAVASIYTLQVLNGALTIKELDPALRGPYYAVRNRQDKAQVRFLTPITFTGAFRVGGVVKAQFIIANQGGQIVQLRELGAAVFGPDDGQLGLQAPRLNFPVEKDVTLQPGQLHLYEQTLLVKQPGHYLVLPTYKFGETNAMPLQPVGFTVR